MPIVMAFKDVRCGVCFKKCTSLQGAKGCEARHIRHLGDMGTRFAKLSADKATEPQHSVVNHEWQELKDQIRRTHDLMHEPAKKC